jgi:hypothetical protein
MKVELRPRSLLVSAHAHGSCVSHGSNHFTGQPQPALACSEQRSPGAPSRNIDIRKPKGQARRSPASAQLLRKPIVLAAVKASFKSLYLKRPSRAAQKRSFACGRLRYSPKTYRYRSGVPMRRITSGWPTTRELNEDLYLRRSYLGHSSSMGQATRSRNWSREWQFPAPTVHPATALRQEIFHRFPVRSLPIPGLLGALSC